MAVRAVARCSMGCRRAGKSENRYLGERSAEISDDYVTGRMSTLGFRSRTLLVRFIPLRLYHTVHLICIQPLFLAIGFRGSRGHRMGNHSSRFESTILMYVLQTSLVLSGLYILNIAPSKSNLKRPDQDQETYTLNIEATSSSPESIP